MATKRKKIVRMSASTAKKRKAAYAARTLKAERIAAWQNYEANLEAFYRTNRGGNRQPTSLRAPEWIAYWTSKGWSVRRRPTKIRGRRPLPPGIARDPATGQFVAWSDVAAAQSYRAEKRRVKRAKAVKRRGLKKDIARQRSRARAWKR